VSIEMILEEKNKCIQQYLEKLLPEKEGYPIEIFEAMRYSVFAGGKRIRPILLLAACELMGGDTKRAMPFAAAIELIHTYSLIHDDLPAMDNDDYRRGKLTNHKMFGEDIAILAGDGLLHYAMEIMADACCKAESILEVRAMQAIAHGAGIYGMLAGQVVDVISEGKKIDEKTLQYIHEHKTAAMLQGALKAGAILGGADEDTISEFEEAGRKIGLAFQIADDILDVVSTQQELGKPIHSDEKNGKTTYVTLFGVEKSREIISQLSQETIEIWKKFGKRGNFLMELTEYLMDRRR
jgi:geranylgeranyl diphosphate synthase type II